MTSVCYTTRQLEELRHAWSCSRDHGGVARYAPARTRPSASSKQSTQQIGYSHEQEPTRHEMRCPKGTGLCEMQPLVRSALRLYVPATRALSPRPIHTARPIDGDLTLA